MGGQPRAKRLNVDVRLLTYISLALLRRRIVPPVNTAMVTVMVTMGNVGCVRRLYVAVLIPARPRNAIAELVPPHKAPTHLLPSALRSSSCRFLLRSFLSSYWPLALADPLDARHDDMLLQN